MLLEARHRDTRMSDKRSTKKRLPRSLAHALLTLLHHTIDLIFSRFITNKQIATRLHTRMIPNKFLTSYPMQTGLWPVTWREPESDRSICVQNTPYSAALPLTSLPLTLSVARLLARVFLAFLLVVENLSTRIFSTLSTENLVKRKCTRSSANNTMRVVCI